MNRVPLTPLDGRYYERVKELVPFLSENALVKYRVKVELEWLSYITDIVGKPFDDDKRAVIKIIIDLFNDNDASEIKIIEKETNHDVKAVEVWLINKLEAAGVSDDVLAYIHFGRTSEDINNLSYALMLREARDQVILPQLKKINSRLEELSEQEEKSVMIARTHGQPATPTTLGKEISVFAYRLNAQINNLSNLEIFGKCNGATGTYAADTIAFPDIDWSREMKNFVQSLGLSFNPISTQIDSHDWLARLNNDLSLTGTILIDLSRDFWQYISMNYLTQNVVAGEVGSSTMPHKVNPIDFENAEANFGVANALFDHLSSKLPISRLQRDLSDSSAMRSLSEAFGHMLLALKSLEKGLAKISGNPELMKTELDQEWALLTEAVQTVMRKNGISDAYNQMKSISRGKTISEDELHQFIKTLDIDENDKKRLLKLTPSTYIGNLC
jgi:adenylosuccinate lyase